MPEVSKCVTVSIQEPVVTIDKVVVLRDGSESTVIYKYEPLSRYEFVADKVTISGGTIGALTVKLLVNNVEIFSGIFYSVSPSTFKLGLIGSDLAELRGWSTVNDMLRAVGAETKTSVDICIKFVW